MAIYTGVDSPSLAPIPRLSLILSGSQFPFCQMKGLWRLTSELPPRTRSGAQGEKSACGDRGFIDDTWASHSCPKLTPSMSMVSQLLQQALVVQHLNGTQLEKVLYFS